VHRGRCGDGDLRRDGDLEPTTDLVVRVPVGTRQFCLVQYQVFFEEAAQLVDVLRREVLLSPGDGVDVARTAGGVVEGLGNSLGKTPRPVVADGLVTGVGVVSGSPRNQRCPAVTPVWSARQAGYICRSDAPGDQTTTGR
jgi:hypothetical protein